MKYQMQSGKAKFSSLLILAIIFYAGYAVVKIVSSNIMNGQIKNSIIEQLGYARGQNFSIEDGEKIVRKVLKDNDVLESDYDNEETGNDNYISDTDNEEAVDEEGEYKGQVVLVELDKKNSLIKFFATYQYELNFIFFKKMKYYEVRGDLPSYE
jgi:uncharacterized membrane protein